MNVIDIVDKYNLTLIKLPQVETSCWTCTKSDLTHPLPAGTSLVEKLIKTGVSDKMWADHYEGLAGVRRTDNGDVYRTFLKVVKTTDKPRWACFANTSLGIGTAFTVNKRIYHGATPEAAVQAFLDSIEE